ncbi:hypothetical protein CIK52_06165 [Kocuria rosea]|uniref:hypothetical protein n=1 Tax=Kocuria rosea TaxID=1275 RepID=UPI000D65A3E1|nr:hypothetical protein [Kocuria rosea]PWF87382.1 hypothetical protein CIK52_06165 [Kocuria rosea]QCY34384.1 hypothetical protein EQG70_17115 [Kocuria rosea]TQN38640.1 hypothetical protein FHX38_0462 [Kocuria rosea]
MWNTFWPDFWVAIIAAVVGSVLTVVIALITYRLQRRSNEKHALRLLVDEIHHRRAFAVIANVRDVPGAQRLDDCHNVNASVLDIHDRIRLAREQARPESGAQKPLSDMTRACNRYRQATAHQPDRSLHDLMSLRNNLWQSIREMAGEVRGVRALEPAAAAY